MQDKPFSGIIECTKSVVEHNRITLRIGTRYYVKPSGAPEWYYLLAESDIKWYTRSRKFLRETWDAGAIKIIKDER